MALTDFERRSYERTETRQRSLSDVMFDIVGDFTILVRKEAQLARAEMSAKMGQATMGLGLLIGGAILIIPALVILLDAAVAGLIRQGLPPYWSALIVGGIVLLIGLIIALIGYARLKPANLAPSKTIEQLQRDTMVARAQGR